MPSEERMYGQLSYWNERYTKEEETFEWYQEYKNIAGKLKDEFPNKDCAVLNLGAGKSKLSTDMIKDGWTNMTSVDFSEVAVNWGKGANGGEWRVLDVRDMTKGEGALADGSFDYAIDKGTLDSLLCGSNSTQNVYQYLQEVKRVLKPGGKFIIISYGAPAKRDPHLKRKSLGFSVSIDQIDKPTAAGVVPSEGMDKVHYVYKLTA